MTPPGLMGRLAEMSYHLAVAGRNGPCGHAHLLFDLSQVFDAFSRLCVLAQFNFVDPGCEGGLVLLILSFTIQCARLVWTGDEKDSFVGL